MKYLIAVIIVLFAQPCRVSAADGDLDLAFGVSGNAGAGFSDLNDDAVAIAIQPDGKIVAAGRTMYTTPIAFPYTTTTVTSANFALVRYNRDGTLDTTFGVGGKIGTEFSRQYNEARAMALQSDGRIIVTGRTWFPGSPAALAAARFNSDGSLDTTFGAGGKLVDNAFDFGSGILIQADGKILICGSTNEQPNSDFSLARYNADGSLDLSFGTSGRVTTDFAGGHDEANAIAMQSDGKIVLLGTTLDLDHSSFALARYNFDGTPDAGFGHEGKVITNFNINGWDDGRALAIQPDGKIVVAGAGLAVESGLRLARYNSDGSLDSGFGDRGMVRDGSDAQSVALQADGKILVATVPFVSSIALYRFNGNGTIDSSFAAGGYVSGDGWDYLALQSDGKIIAAGPKFLIARYNTVLDLIHLDRTTVGINASFTALLSGANFTGQTYFDVRFRAPGNNTDEVALDWQQGLSAPHPVTAGTPAGNYTVTGIRPHKNMTDSDGDFLPVSVTLTVLP